MATDSFSPDLKDALAGLSEQEQRQLLSKLLREKAERAKAFPMSASQQGLWHAFKRDPNDTHYNVFLPLRVRSELNLEALQDSLNLVVDRHTSLRTVFGVIGDQLIQRVCSELKPDIDVRRMHGADEERVRHFLAQESQHQFDLETGPLLRIVVCELAGNDWVLLALAHHIVVDFWSLMLILNEVRGTYPVLAEGREPLLPAAVNNYAEFVHEQHELLSSPRGQALREYWQRTIQGTSTVVEFPIDRIRPRRFSGKAGNVPLVFSHATAQRLKQFALETQSTSSTVLQAALRVLISRYTGVKDFLIGCPFSGRSQRKYESTVGFFVNMLPLKADLSDDPSLTQLTRRTMNKLQTDLEHEQYPFSRIVSDAAIPRDAGRTPLFQVCYTFEKSQLKEEVGRAGFLLPGQLQSVEFAGTQQESFHLLHPTCRYDLEFIFEQTPVALRGMICYASDLFDPESVQEIARNFAGLLDALLAFPETAISRVPWAVQPGPRNSPRQPPGRVASPVTSVGNVSTATHQCTVDQLLLRSGASTQVAMQSEDTTLTYDALHRHSARIAHSLNKLGVGKGQIVPVLAAKGPAAFLLLLAVHRAGAAALPIDTQQGQNLDFVLGDSQAKVMVVDNALATQQFAATAANALPVLTLDELLSLAHTDEAPEPSNQPDDLAYVIYTSGSTGRPKAVQIEHGAVYNTLLWRMSEVPLARGDRLLMLLSHQFDAGLGNAWTTLSQGATIVWADADAQHDASRMLDQVHRDDINVLPAVPSLLKILLQHPRFPEGDKLRYVWTGGEVVPPELAGQLRKISSAAFWNFYGPTEASIESAACNITQHEAERPVPIGYPVTGTEILVLDEHRKVVPDTVPGELAISGQGLARGYLNQPELTAAKFIALPNDESGRTRLYLTGDRGRWNASGQLEFLGRTDDQVKLNGYRIELGEIESVLRSHPSVDRSAVKLAGSVGSGGKLLAYVSLKAGRPPDASESLPSQSAAIRRFIAERLPAYKLPAAVIVLDQLPTTSGGKIDKARLPDSSADFDRQQFVAPTTPLEEYLARAWCNVLELEQIGIDQNFFDAGGNSLQAAIVTSRLSQDLSVDVPTALIFDLADIAHVARRLVELYPTQMLDRFGVAIPADEVSQSSVHPLIASFGHGPLEKPLFMVHPPGGIVACYRELAQHLDEGQLIGIRSRGLHGAEPLPATLPEMAADYVAAIRSAQPSGPYTVGGWSLGGLVAYEMAQQLLANGDLVTRVILLDTAIPAGATELAESSADEVGLEYGIDLTLEELSELAPEDQLPFLWNHAKKLGVLEDDSPPELVERVLRDLQGLFHHHVMLSRDYKLKPLDAPITLYRPSQTPLQMPNDGIREPSDRGWNKLSSHVDVHFVPGHHHSMVQSPQVGVLASQIAAQLREDKLVGRSLVV